MSTNTENELRDTQTALLNILEDTEEARVRAEEEKDKTVATITNFSDGIMVFDSNHVLTLVNPQAEVFLKIRKKSVIGKSVPELAQNPKIKRLCLIFGNNIKRVFRKELKLEDDRVIEITTIALKRRNHPSEHLVVLHDVTREKVVEKLKTEFVSISAHQLRTPLSAVKWTLGMILDGDIGKITREQRKFLEQTRISNERMINLVNSLLDVTRIEEGRFVNQKSLASITDITKSVLEVLAEEIKRKKLRFRFINPSKPLPLVNVDVEKIRLVIQNIIDNAIKYTLPGKKVTIRLRLLKNNLEFRITDEGVGIPQKQEKRIFSKFFRGTNVVKLETVGSGLGLFISKNIIEAHDGTFKFKSKEGKGSTFWFTLPIKNKTRKKAY
ncbi:MAG: ATP-binding protein [Patescibacteria group bacterium]|nr:ATP-binding protein [Patescibacteria group bacterium]